MKNVLLATTLLTAAGAAADHEPIRLHPDNPHYFLFRGQPTLLVTSGEHYGAVLNRDFDYGPYLKTLAAHGFNQTRTFSGAYCEPPGAFNIQHNTLAPADGRLICPWARSETPGYARGGNKFDLTKFDPDYFRRLKDFVAEAGRRGVVVEYVLFCPFYEDSRWQLSPMNAANNVNGIGQLARTDVYTLKDRDLTAVQDALVRKVVEELADFDNVYYEICNEPYFGGVTLQWQAHIAGTIAAAEERLEVKHLIAQNVANNFQKIEGPDPRVSLFNFHYAEPRAAADNYALGKALGDDETGFKGPDDKPYRIEAWEFLLSGGGLYSNLDYSFTVDHPDGTAENKAPGGGGPELRKQLQILKEFLEGFDFLKLQPAPAVVRKLSPDGTTARVLADPGRAYAIYVKGRAPAELTLDLPQGDYTAEWIDTKTGKSAGKHSLKHDGGETMLKSPQFEDDVALRITRADSR